MRDINKGENVGKWDVGRDASIQITYQDSYWADLDTEFIGILRFTVELSQNSPVLQSAHVTFSFDCHPGKDVCHGEKKACQRNGYQGVVKYTLPKLIHGRNTQTKIVQTDQIQVSPKINLPSIGTFDIGSITHSITSNRDQITHWTLKSSRNPPSKHKTFQIHTDSKFDWRHNSDNINDYPPELQVGMIIKYDKKHSPLLVRPIIGGALKHGLFSGVKREVRTIKINDSGKDLDKVVNNIGVIYSQNQHALGVSFRVSCLNDQNHKIRLVGAGQALGNWDPRSCYGLRQEAVNGTMTDWRVIIFAKVDDTFEYKFIKMTHDEKRFCWEASENHRYTVQPVLNILPNVVPAWETDWQEVSNT